MEVPGNTSTGDPSPHLTDIEDRDPSGSLAVNVTFTICPVLAGLVTLDIATLGG